MDPGRLSGASPENARHLQACERESLEGAGWAVRNGAEAPDEGHVAAHVEAFDRDDADGTEAQLLADGPLGDKAGAEAGFDRGDDGNDGVEVHGNAEILQAKAGMTQGQLDDAAGAGTSLAHEQGNLSERADGNRGLRRPRITTPHDQHDAVLEKALAKNLATGNGSFDESQIDPSFGESNDHLVCVAARHMERNPRMLFEKGTQHAGKDVLGDGHGSADAQGAGGFSAQEFEGGARLVGKRGALARIGQQQSARCGEADAALAAIEQRGFQLLFQRPNLLAHGRLAQVQLLRGATETGFVGDGTKDLEPEILHSAIL
jgi:hypothetical protein